MFVISTLLPLIFKCIVFNMTSFLSAVAVLLAVIIILITGALAVGVFLNYKRTGSFIPSMPKLPRYYGFMVIFYNVMTHVPSS